MLKYLLQPVVLYCFILTANVPLKATRCSGTKLDLVFLLDLGPGELVSYLLDFFWDLLLYADVDSGKVRLGLVFYSKIIFVKFHLKQHSKKADIYQDISSFLKSSEEQHNVLQYTDRNIADALKFTRSEMFNEENGDRQRVNNVIVFLTHGVSSMNSGRTIPEAELARSEGIHIYAIGLSVTNKTELKAIATKPADANSFFVRGYKQLSDLKQIIVKALYKKCDLNYDSPCDSDCLLECTESCQRQDQQASEDGRTESGSSPSSTEDIYASRVEPSHPTSHTTHSPQIVLDQVSRPGFDTLAAKCNLTETGIFVDTGCLSSEVSNLVNNIKNVSKEDFTRAINKVSDVIMKLNSTSTSPDDVTNQIIYTLQAVGEKVLDPNFKVDRATFKTLVSLTDIVTSSQQRIWQVVKEEEGPATISSLISSLEEIAFKGFSDNRKNKIIYIVKNTIAVNIGTVLQDIIYPNSRLNHSNTSVAKHWIDKNEIFLSHCAFSEINSSVKYSIVVIKNQHNATKFDLLKYTLNESRGQAIVSDILALSVNVNLTTPLNSSVRLTFGGLQLQPSYRKLACVFLKTSTGGRETWSSEGCEMENITDDHIICTCNHLTTFAVLASPFEQLHLNVLSSLTIAGCTVSIVCLAVTVVVYLYLWRYIRSERSILLVDLSVCMMIAYLIFVVGIDKTEDKIACKVVAICLHYCFLTVFCNFLSQSLALYTSIHSMTEKHRRKLYLLLTHLCPLIIVSITLAVYKTEGYGTEKYCWLSHERGFIWSFLGPIIGIIFVNGLVLLAVICIAQRNRALEGQGDTVKIFSVVRAIVILTPLFGLTWIFGLLSINDDYVVFQYLFVILNSFQGLFIFVIHCLANRQVREAFQKLMRKKNSVHLDSNNKMTSSLPHLTSN